MDPSDPIELVCPYVDDKFRMNPNDTKNVNKIMEAVNVKDNLNRDGSVSFNIIEISARKI